MGKPLTVMAVLAAFGLSACQSIGTSGIVGAWATDDGVAVTTFSNGSFSTRVTSTNEVVAEGSYSEGADGLQLSWFSVVANEQRSAVCRRTAANRMTCEPRGGNAFSMTRVT